MAVTATAALVSTFTGDAARPPGHAGWNNFVGDPGWVPDNDWYRRVQLSCSGNAGEDTRVVNWECYDATVPFKTTAELATATAGAVASPFGPLINNTSTWTVWATTGVATAAAAKYFDTKTPAVSKLRANGQRVQVLLGARKVATSPTEVWTVAAFLPGAGAKPTAFATVTVQKPLGVQQTMLPLDPGEGLVPPEDPEGNQEPEPTPPPEPEPEPEPEPPAGETPPEEAPKVPTTAHTKAEIFDWLSDQGVHVEDPGVSSMTKAELLELVQNIVDGLVVPEEA